MGVMKDTFRPATNVDANGSPIVRDDVGARVDAAANGTGPPVQIGSHTLGPGATPQQIDEAKKMLSYQTDNPVQNWSGKDVVRGLAEGGVKAMAGGALLAGGFTLLGAGYGAGAAGAAGAGGAGTLAPITNTAVPMAGGHAGVQAAINAAPAITGSSGAAGMAALSPAVKAAGMVAPKAGLFSRAGQWIGKNKDLVGNVVSGIADAAGDEADHDQALELMREERNLVSANYAGANPGAKYRGLMPGAQPQAPQRSTYDKYDSFSYEYDARLGKVVKVSTDPSAPAAPV